MLASAPAWADSANPPPPEQATPLPPPGQESGRIDHSDDEDSTARDIAQGVLFVPRAVVELAFAPVRAGVWAFDRYRLWDRYKGVFVDDNDIYGVYPTARIESDYGVTLGGRFVHRDLLGAKEQVALNVSFGDSIRRTYEGRLRSGEHLTLDLHAQLEDRPREVFYGLGNVDYVKTYHRQEIKRGAVAADVQVIDDVHAIVAGAITDLRYGVSDQGPPIDQMFDPGHLPGWPGTRNLYGELELHWSTRRAGSELGQRGTFARGTLVSAFAGRAHQLAGGNDYWRYGGDAQQFVWVAPGPRVLFARLHVEAVTGSADDVAFTQLPELGGSCWLRGYPRSRFRDRMATVGSLEYTWDLGRNVRASVFTDGGRVFHSPSELELHGFRLGYGGTLQLHTHEENLGTLTLASSIDGGVYFSVTFDPVFIVEPRVEQQ